jgi:hypothetical protein
LFCCQFARRQVIFCVFIYVECITVFIVAEDSTLLHQLLSLFFSHLVGESEFKLSKHLSNVLVRVFSGSLGLVCVCILLSDVQRLKDKISHVRWCNSCVHLRGQEISLNTDNNVSFILSEPDTSRVCLFTLLCVQNNFNLEF